LKDLLSVLKDSEGTVNRRNFFKIIEYRELGDIVTVSYWNKAMLQQGQETEVKIWLESVVLKETRGQWRIHVLHSTRLNTEHYPEDVDYEEYNRD
jgi:ketosteroid isomerase-like protein